MAGIHPEVQELLDAMRELETFLQHHDEPFWATNIGRCADQLSNSDAYGLERFLSMLGGMGSLNDLILHRDGKWLVVENDQLDALRTKAGGLASALTREIR